VSLKDLFSTSDVVSIHLPVNENTKGMIDQELLDRMQPHAIFVNTSRAAVVKREDLLGVLENQKIKGAVLDVFDSEPPDDVDYKLIRRSNVLATPHIAGATHEVEDHHVEILNNQLINHFFEEKTA
jgi:D-3-phosphoglycerate dehydrogenase